MIKLLRTTAFLLCTAVSAPATAQNYSEGWEAYHADDYETALQEFMPLAEQGHAPAQNYIGVMYKNGYGVVQVYAEAVNWYRLAAEQGNVYAQTNLGYTYKNGNGVIQSSAEAVEWFRLAAEQGHVSAQNGLGDMYSDGNGIIQSPAEAVEWYRLAAEQGNAYAQYNLGNMYRFKRSNGGLIKDDVIAHMWFNISSANGHSHGSIDRDELGVSMTREQIVEAQSLAQRCMASDYQDCD
jgi:TPR repeat protein